MENILARLDGIEAALARKIGPWLTTLEAADYLRCSARKLEDLASRGLLPFHRQDPTLPKSPRLFHRRHLTAFLFTGRNPVTHRLSNEEKRKVDELL